VLVELFVLLLDVLEVVPVLSDPFDVPW
jgi:hypothetical protein